MAFIIDVNSKPVTAVLTALRDKVGDVSPFLKAVGEDMVERIKGRFSSGTAPDGSRWAPNSQVTIIRYLQARGGFSEKTGKINARGRALATAKKPLQGETGFLAQENHYNVSDDELIVYNAMGYAAMQQFGGTRAEFPNLWGDIPARPFFPITPSGELYPTEEETIVETLRQYLGG